MTSIGAQQVFFQHIKEMLPPHLSFVDEIAEELNISNDSAYRRIRGDKPITLEEIRKLCARYKISLDKLLQLDSDSVVFSGKRASHEDFNFTEYLQEYLHTHLFLNSFKERELLILPKDVPVYHYYHFPELAAFKYFFWMKTILHYPDYNKKLFNPNDIPDSLLETGKKILAAYNDIPSTEIWNVENINTTLRQIDYYRETNVFQNEEDIIKIYECLEKSMDYVEMQAELGYKINNPGKNQSEGKAFNLYINDFSLGDNTYLPIVDGKKIVFLVHCHLNYISTRDEGFADYAYQHIQNILQKSTLISVVCEKDRRKFFNQIRANILERKLSLNNHLV